MNRKLLFGLWLALVLLVSAGTGAYVLGECFYPDCCDCLSLCAEYSCRRTNCYPDCRSGTGMVCISQSCSDCDSYLPACNEPGAGKLCVDIGYDCGFINNCLCY